MQRGVRIMTYEMPWPGWDETTRATITASLAELDDDVADIARQLGQIIGDDLRDEFFNVDPALVGWVAMRTASHLGGIAREADADGTTLALVGLLAGQHVEAGAA